MPTWIHSVFRHRNSINTMAIRYLASYMIFPLGINATILLNNFRKDVVLTIPSHKLICVHLRNLRMD